MAEKDLLTNYEKYLTDHQEFNAQNIYLIQLLQRWDEIDKASVLNDLPTYYRLLRTFWIKIRYRIQVKVYTEKGDFKKDEQKINQSFDKAENLIFNNDRQTTKDNMKPAEIILRNLHRTIIELLFRSGTIFPHMDKNFDWKDEERRNFL